MVISRVEKQGTSQTTSRVEEAGVFRVVLWSRLTDSVVDSVMTKVWCFGYCSGIPLWKVELRIDLDHRGFRKNEVTKGQAESLTD